MPKTNRVKPIVLAGMMVLSLFGLYLVNPTKSKEEQPLPVQKVEAGNVEATTTDSPKTEQLETIVEKPVEETVNPSVMLNQPTINGEYELSIEMEKENTFHVTADITVMNTSADSWKDVGFYFLPNAFTEENKPEFMKDSATFTIHSIGGLDKELAYELSNNKLLVKLDKELQPNDQQQIHFSYTVNLPENGIRFSKVDNNYYLTQWYPMIGTYDDGWNIVDFNSSGESYHTGYGNFTIHYKLFQPYYVVSSGVEGVIQPRTEGTIHGQFIKDYYLSFLDQDAWESKTTTVNETEIRAFVPKQALLPVDDYLSVGEESFRYFEEKLGGNPNKQLDIIVNNGGMEYPNVVEVAEEERLLEKTIVHEVAHQWFYFLVSNDPFYEAWLDEGLTEFTTSLYLTEKYGEETGYDFPNVVTSGMYKPLEFVNLPLSDFDRTYGATVYGRTTLKLKEFFDANGGQEEAWKFLSDYYQANQYTISTTEHFVDFFVQQYGEEGRSFLESWLKI